MSVAALTNDEEHFWRLVRILLDDVPNQLRSMFKSKFQLKYNVPWLDNQMSGAFFVVKCNTSRTPKHITGVIRQGNTAFFDSTALFTCLLFSGTGILLPTPRGKGARTGPIEDSERVDELREMRNEFAHATSTSLPRTSFNQKLALLNTIYAQLHWNPTLMRQWAQDPVVTAECVNLQQRLTVERQRYIALDGTVQVLAAVQHQHVQDITQIQQQQQEQGLEVTRLLQQQQDIGQQVTQLQGQQHEQGQEVTQLEQQHQEVIAVQQQHGRHISQQQESQRQLQDQVNRHGEDITQMKQHHEAVQMSAQRAKDELERWRKQLIGAQRRMLYRYVEKKNEEESTDFQDLTDMFVDLRIHNSREKYHRKETRIHHDHLQLQMEIERCPQISVKDLFEPEWPGMTPVRSLVVGTAGIGKSILSLHIVDQWLRNELLPNAIHQLFHFRLRDLSSKEMCSLEELFFGCQNVGKPSPQAVVQFFDQLQADPTRFVIIFDGLDEATVTPTENRAFAFNEQVEMPRLIASIINGYTLPSVRLLVTSRPGGVTHYDMYDKKAEIYGFTRERMSDYIEKFSGANDNVQKSIEDYIDQNVNICSFCYIPVHLNIICRIVKFQMQQNCTAQLPTTLTELYVGSVRNFLLHHHPTFKDPNANKSVDVIAKLKGPVLDHANLACYGMEQDPIAITFSNKEMYDFHLEKIATQCGLVSESRESSVVMFTPSVTPVHFFHHLTVQEFLAAVALVIDNSRLQSMMTRTSNRQHELVFMFLAGLLGNKRNHQFLHSLHTEGWQNPRWGSILEELIKSVVVRERNNEANTRDQSVVHKASTLFLVSMIHESRQPELWCHVSDYILKGDTKLDLTWHHMSPTEQRALAYVLPQTRLTSLKLTGCGLMGDETRNLLVAVGDLHTLIELRLAANPDLHGATMSSIFNSLVKLTNLKILKLGACRLDNEDVEQVETVVTSIPRLEELRLGHNNIGDVGALKVTQVAARHASLQRLGLLANCVTETGVDDIRRVAQDTPRLWLVGVDHQRRPGEDEYTDDVEGYQRWLNGLQSALARLKTRPLVDRDRWWGKDVAEIQHHIDVAQSRLREAESERQSQY